MKTDLFQNRSLDPGITEQGREMFGVMFGVGHGLK